MSGEMGNHKVMKNGTRTLLVLALSQLPCLSTAAENTIQSGLQYVRNAGEAWMKKRGCVSCHQIPSMIWAHEAAKSKGAEVPAQRMTEWKTWSTKVKNFVKPPQKADCDEDATMAANIDTMAAMLLAIPKVDSANWRKTFASKLAAEQQANGSWRACGQLPAQHRPVNETHATTTLWVALSLAQEGTPFDRDAAMEFVDGVTNPTSTEFLAVRMLVAESLLEAATVKWEEQLLRLQNGDGGWGWRSDQPSDALGTGYALYALARAGGNAEAISRARKYLTMSQGSDGRWKVPGTKELAKGKPTATANDWGSAWAIIALAESQ